MNNFKLWCDKVMPFVFAESQGEIVQASCDNGNSWFDLRDSEMSDPALQFDFGDYDYRIKPRTIKIGDFDVPEPMRDEPEFRSMVYCVSPNLEYAVLCYEWSGSDVHKLRLSRGMLHSSMDAAKIHAAAIISLTAAK